MQKKKNIIINLLKILKEKKFKTHIFYNYQLIGLKDFIKSQKIWFFFKNQEILKQHLFKKK